MSLHEKIYYQIPNVLITNTRAVLSAKTYSMSNITSVSSGVIPANRLPGIIIALIGIAFASCCGLFGLIAFANATSLNQGMGNLILDGLGLLFGLLAIVVGLLVAFLPKDSYIVRIGSASGEANALASKDWNYIAPIIEAMNQAIIDRG